MGTGPATHTSGTRSTPTRRSCGAGRRWLSATQSWIYPSGDDCLKCHTAAAGYALGLESAQLNHDFTYASTGRTANELRTLDDVVMFTTPLGDPAAQPALPDPFGTAALGERARAYLHTNCSQCHRPNGPTPSSMDLRYSTALANTGACDAPPQSGDLGIGAAARIIAPGSAASSVLRRAHRSPRRQPNAAACDERGRHRGRAARLGLDRLAHGLPVGRCSKSAAAGGTARLLPGAPRRRRRRRIVHACC